MKPNLREIEVLAETEVVVVTGIHLKMILIIS